MVANRRCIKGHQHPYESCHLGQLMLEGLPPGGALDLETQQEHHRDDSCPHRACRHFQRPSCKSSAYQAFTPPLARSFKYLWSISCVPSAELISEIRACCQIAGKLGDLLKGRIRCEAQTFQNFKKGQNGNCFRVCNDSTLSREYKSNHTQYINE